MTDTMALRIRTLIRGDREYAQELAQEVTLRLLRMEARGKVIEEATLGRLVARVAYRIRMNQWRDASRRPTVSLTPPDISRRLRAPIVGPDVRFEAREALRTIRDRPFHTCGGAREVAERALEALANA